MKIRSIDRDSFINTAVEIHHNLYNYDKFVYTKSINKSIIICKKHGEFLQSANKHLQGRGCPKCRQDKIVYSKANTYHNSIYNRIIKYHETKYDVSNTIFKKAKDNINIICPIHGEFSIQQDSFLRGQGCQKCSLEEMRYKATGFTSEMYLKRYYATNKFPYLYIVYFYNNDEEFIKIGITYDIDKRFNKNIPYKIKLIGIINVEPELVMSLEKLIKRGIKEFFPQYKYKPKINFGGHTECYTMEIMNFFIECGYNIVNNERK